MNKNIRIKLLAALLSVIMLLSLAVPTYAITFSYGTFTGRVCVDSEIAKIDLSGIEI